MVNDNTVAGTFGYLHVVARDSYQNNLSSCVPYQQYFADFTGVRYNKTFHESSQSILCLQTELGTYVIPYNLTQATQWAVDVSGQVANVSNSPIELTVVHADIYQPNSYLNDFNPDETLVVGQQVAYSLTLSDFWQNIIVDCPDINFTHWNVYTISYSGKHMYNATLECNTGAADGTYQGTYTALRTGLYDLVVEYMDLDLAGSPYHPLNFTYGYPSKLSYAMGPGVESESLIAGNQTWFKIVTFNQFNVSIQACPPAPFSPSNWSVSFDQSYRWDEDITTVKVGACDDTDGSFTGFYTPTKALSYDIVITLDGQDIQDDPYTPTVLPAAVDPLMTVVTGLNSTGDNGTIILQTYDQYGNMETSVNKSEFFVTLSPRCAASTVTTEANGGTILAHYVVYEGGVYCPSISYKEYIVPLKNATIHAVGGIACNNSCNYRGYCFKNFAPSTVTTNFSCNCFQGYTGVECSDKMSSKYPLAVGAVVGLIVGLAVLMFIIGLILGFVVFKFLSRRGGAEIEPLI